MFSNHKGLWEKWGTKKWIQVEESLRWVTTAQEHDKAIFMNLYVSGFKKSKIVPTLHFKEKAIIITVIVALKLKG